MPTVKCQNIIKNLPKKGFVIEYDRDHIYLFYYIDGNKSQIHTKISHGQRERNGNRIWSKK